MHREASLSSEAANSSNESSNHWLGSLDLAGMVSANDQSILDLEAKFDVDANGSLTVTATDMATQSNEVNRVRCRLRGRLRPTQEQEHQTRRRSPSRHSIFRQGWVAHAVVSR
jgi:molecular chaperone DnaK (HSP70)